MKNFNIYFIAIFAYLEIRYCFPLSKASITFTSLNEDIICPRIQWTNLTSGTLFSPNFPGSYPNNANCTYMLTCPIGTRVTVIFEIIKLDPCCDHIFLYDGPGINATNLISQISESSTTYKYETIVSNIMTVHFVSDANYVLQGFYAVFSTSDDTITQCSSNNYSNLFGVVVSPDYPSSYPPNSDCSYLIGNGQPETVILLTINFFHTEGCCDNLKIFDGINASGNATQT
uniref:CUB domain-containing protein n=1 Tax=Panagrolaimus superbus TaxID=310955 RepID=A0A914YNY9_9BILA